MARHKVVHPEDPHVYTLEDNTVRIELIVTFKKHPPLHYQRTLRRRIRLGLITTFADWTKYCFHATEKLDDGKT